MDKTKPLDCFMSVRFREDCRMQLLRTFGLDSEDEPFFVEDITYFMVPANLMDLVLSKIDMIIMNGVSAKIPQKLEQFVVVCTIYGDKILSDSGNPMWIPAKYFEPYLEDEDKHPTA